MVWQDLYEQWESFGVVDYDKSLFIEYITLCNFMSDEDFDFYLNPDQATEAEFCSVLDFLYHRNCHMLLYRFLRDNQKRLLHPDFSSLEGITLRSDIEKRFKKYYF